MALYDVVNGVYRKVAKKYDPVEGVYRKVKKAYDPVGGVYRQYFSGGLTAGSLAVGASVWLSEDGTLKEFIVVHKGRPSTLYDASCDGVWLMEKYYTYANRRTSYASSTTEVKSGYPSCRPNTWLNGVSFYDRLDSKTKSIIKQVKIPYYLYDSSGFTTVKEVKSGANGLSTKIFIPSAYELGWTSATDSRMMQDGACLAYFKGSTATARRILTVSATDNTAMTWWTRSYLDATYIVSVRTDGEWARTYYSGACYMRPTFIIESNTPIDNSTGKNIIA